MRAVVFPIAATRPLEFVVKPRMLRRAWKPVAAVAIVGTPAYYYYTLRNRPQSFDIQIKVRGTNGKTEMATKTFSLLSLAALEQRIKDGATSSAVSRPGGITWKHTTATLASNDPIEDANAHQIVQRDSTDPSAPGDYLFFTVMDGHGGFQTSQLLSRVLINAVALELTSLIESSKPAEVKSGVLNQAKSLIWSTSSNSASTPPAVGPQQVSLAIKNAFTKLDNEILNAPLHVLANNLDENSRKNKLIPDLSHHPLALTTMLPAISGSCALMAVFDTAHRDLYIACTGDSRAVAGVWEQTGDGKGVWRVEVLSEDQTGRNPNELKRVQSEHPPDEANDVIREGRILGGLEPSRAFGDARYKWPRAIQETLSQAFLVGNGKPIRPAPSLFKTPPYVTAEPVVTHRKLSLPPQASTTSPGTLRFLVLATDGLWDELSSEEVVGLVGGHLAGLKGKVRKSELPSLIPTTSGAPTVEGKDKRGSFKEGSWAFADENLSAHLIRNAFGGGDEMVLRQRMSIPAPYSRRYRDDVTVTVVWWEEGREAETKVSTFTEQVKSKL